MNNRALYWFLAVFLVIAAILCYATYKPDPPMVSVSEWHRTEDFTPPDSKPICGMWIDYDKPEVEVVRKIGGNFYEYNSNPFAPTALLYGYPPLYWSEMPGAAE